MMKLALWFLATLALVGCAQRSCADPNNFVQWRSGLWSSAQPSAQWLGRVKDKYDLIINLAPPQNHGSIAEEGGIVGAQGVTYVNIPVDFSAPTPEDFRMFTEVLRAANGKKVFVHCQMNLRGSSFLFLYRVLHEQAPVSETLATLTGVWVPDKVWKGFIEQTLAAHGKKAEVL